MLSILFLSSHFVSFLSGTHSRSVGQMDSNWRWDLGQGYCIRAQPKSGKSICTSAGINDKWLWWWFRWYEVSTIDKRCPATNTYKSTQFLRFYLYVSVLFFFHHFYWLMHHIYISNLSGFMGIFSNLSACWLSFSLMILSWIKSGRQLCFFFMMICFVRVHRS